MELSISHYILSLEGLSSTSKLLYGVIDAHKDENEICNCTALTLSSILGVHRNSVVRCVGELQKNKLIDVIEGKSSRNGLQYSYRVKDFYEHLRETSDDEAN